MKPKYLNCLYHLKKGRKKISLIIETCIGKDINCISSIKVIPQNTQRLTQRHDSAASLFSPLHLIISSWLSKNTILACYVYVKFHNKELVQGEILSAMWVVHLVLLCAEEFIFMCITEENKKLYRARNVRHKTLSYMINHYMKRNNFLRNQRNVAPCCNILDANAIAKLNNHSPSIKQPIKIFSMMTLWILVCESLRD